MPYRTQPTRCPRCGRDNLTPDDFPKSEYGYVYGICLLCEAARVQRNRDNLRNDLRRYARHLAKERLRVATFRERKKENYAT